MVGRLGGGEFAVVLNELDYCEDAAAVAEKLGMSTRQVHRHLTKAMEAFERLRAGGM